MVVKMNVDTLPKSKVVGVRRYQGPPIVNEFDFQTELLINGKKHTGNREDYTVIRKRCETGHFQGTNDEKLYYKVISPVHRYVNGEHICESKSMYFKDFFQYLNYLALKYGPEPKKEFFSSYQSFRKAHSKWKRKQCNVNLIKGMGWNDYVEKNPNVINYLRRYEEQHTKELENYRNRLEMIEKLRKASSKDNGWIEVRYDGKKSKFSKNKKNILLDSNSRLLVSPALVKVDEQ